MSPQLTICFIPTKDARLPSILLSEFTHLLQTFRLWKTNVLARSTIKVIQQTAPVGTYSGPLDVFKQTVKRHGFLSLYQGLASPLVGSMIDNAVVFTAYKRFQRLLGVEENVWSSRIKYALAGMGAGVFTATILTPVELIKCKLQIQQMAQRAGGASASDYKGPVDVIVKVVRKEGIQGLYRGHVACLARELPGNFAWFGTYEAILREFQERFGYKDRESVPLALKSLAGSIGGVCYWAVPFPFE